MLLLVFSALSEARLEDLWLLSCSDRTKVTYFFFFSKFDFFQRWAGRQLSLLFALIVQRTHLLVDMFCLAKLLGNQRRLVVLWHAEGHRCVTFFLLRLHLMFCRSYWQIQWNQFSGSKLSFWITARERVATVELNLRKDPCRCCLSYTSIGCLSASAYMSSQDCKPSCVISNLC